MAEELKFPTVEISDKEKSLAAFNHPTDSLDEFVLGERSFKVLYLEYDDYLEFLSLLQPLFNSIAGSMTAKEGVSLPGIPLSSEKFSFSSILQYCAKDLPKLVTIICNQQAKREERKEDLVDVAWVKKNAGSPFALAKIVSLQVARNKFITEIADFFAQFLPLFQKVTNLSRR